MLVELDEPNYFLAKIKMKEIIKPNNKLPLSPKNNFGSLKIAKLKNKKRIKSKNIDNKSNLIVSSVIKKNKIINTVSEVNPNEPSIPSK